MELSYKDKQEQHVLWPFQVWSQWEDDGVWSDSLLRGIETSFPTMHKEGDSEEQISEELSIYQVILIHTYALSNCGADNTNLPRVRRLEDTERTLFMFHPAHLETTGCALYAALCAWHSKPNWLNYIQVNGLFSVGAHGVPRLWCELLAQADTSY